MGFQVIRMQLDQTGQQVITLTIDDLDATIRRTSDTDGRFADISNMTVDHLHTSVDDRIGQHDTRIAENLLCRSVHSLTLC